MRKIALHLFNALHAYVYGRWTEEYVSLLRNRILPRLSPQRKKTLADGFHCKVLQCPHKALSLVCDERKGIPLDVRLLN